MPDTHDDLGAEVHQLLNAVQDWARRFPEASGDEHARGECLPWCPICQFASLLRGEHPEVTERLTEAAGAIAAAMKALTDAALTRTQAGTERPGGPKPAPRVEHIRLDDPTEN